MSTIAKFSLAEYDRMLACGVFDVPTPRRVELIRGEIRDMNPIGPMHEDLLDLLAEWSHQALRPGQARVRVQNSIGLSDCAPQPDLVWAVPRRYWAARPTAEDVLLLVEVAETSLEYDLGEKADLYAAARIQDYWVVNVPDRTIVVHRRPTPSGYAEVRPLAGNEEIRPLALPEAVLRPSMLWTQ